MGINVSKFEVSPLIPGCLVVFLGINVSGFEVSPSICRCLVVFLGFEVSSPFVGVWLFSWGLKCLLPFVDVWLFSCSGTLFHMSYFVTVATVLSLILPTSS